MPTQLKLLLTSTTAWAIFVSLLASALAKYHVVIDTDTQSKIVDFCLQGVACIAGIVAIARHVALKATTIAIAAMACIIGCQPFNVTGQMAVQTQGWDFRLAPVSIYLQPLPVTPAPTTAPATISRTPTPLQPLAAIP